MALNVLQKLTDERFSDAYNAIGSTNPAELPKAENKLPATRVTFVRHNEVLTAEH